MTTAKQIVTDELLCELREQLESLRSNHNDLLCKAEEISPRIMKLYHSIWEPEERLISEFNSVQENIRLADFLAHKPKK